MAESWGYSVLDTEEYWKSSKELIEKLVEIRSKGGNYLLNIGPDGQGRIPELTASRLNDIAKWMEVHAEAIYGVQPTKGKTGIYNGYMAQKDRCIYLYVKPHEQKNLLLYIDPREVDSVTLLTPKGERPVKYHAAYGNGICITLPSKLPFASLSVLKVKRNDVANKTLEIED